MAGEKILIVDDEQGMRRLLDRVLSREGYETIAVAGGDEALRELGTGGVDLALVDIQMPGMTGLELLERIKAFDPAFPTIMITAYGTVESAVKALRAGAYDYITKPFETDEIKLTVAKAFERERLLAENRYLHEELAQRYRFTGVISESARMQEVFDMASSVAASNANVLITGESGTGKELMARSIHSSSPRKDKPFVVLNCAALSEGVLESELFGHEKGAFTGALGTRKGRFELAHEGTLFIDEVGEMSLNAQVKLLRVIQEHEFERVGGTRTIRTDVRIVAATNKNLEDEVRAGRFREDLYYRLNVVNLHVPPLRERREDIESLARHFLMKFAAEMGKPISDLSPRAHSCLLAYDWPGNVRELQNAMERAVVMARGAVITPRDLPQGLQDQDEICLKVPERGGSLTELLEDLERQLIVQTLRREQGSQTRAAEVLGTKRTTLRYKMEKYGLLERGE
ncbi:two-component system, NtrC family, response regulator AtoC [Geoalkalibacter ferrihydriticus]|uniref:Fis family transcriptional regulator n=2 Tax=Geoalkalibacter ferrihydriticus TaxID=392333 RepID=A0A0C2HFW0_9BACT|nr:sigma-54 dependent transcriptional regulator [Geoalkalibacter ferrihydriticus]KIH75806.1 Fis family transcriptional regulator [Geoalkalibacter ferrihydriticus DSM 17813]SDM65860.1 two-component system, NtrC family, response regulator AtoC [Geoalkalibacter ferrihydriticus]